MGKLNQVLAVERNVRSQAQVVIDEAYHKAQKSALFEGITKTYLDNDENGDKLQGEDKKVQLTARQVLETVSDGFAELLTIVARKDFTNAVAKADIVVDGSPIAREVPVPYLLFLEKQLVNVRTVVKALPVLDSVETFVPWTPNQQ